MKVSRCRVLLDRLIDSRRGGQQLPILCVGGLGIGLHTSHSETERRVGNTGDSTLGIALGWCGIDEDGQTRWLWLMRYPPSNQPGIQSNYCYDCCRGETPDCNDSACVDATGRRLQGG